MNEGLSVPKAELFIARRVCSGGLRGRGGPVWLHCRWDVQVGRCVCVCASPCAQGAWQAYSAGEYERQGRRKEVVKVLKTILEPKLRAETLLGASFSSGCAPSPRKPQGLLIRAMITLTRRVGAARREGSTPRAASGPGPGLQIDFDVTGGLSKSCGSKIPGGLSLLLWSVGKLIIPINS